MIIDLDRKKMRRRKLIRLYFIIFLIVAIPVFFRLKNPTASRLLVSPVPDDPLIMETAPVKASTDDRDPAELEHLIKTGIGNEWTNYSIVVTDMNGPFSMDIGGTVIYTAASVNKIPILTALYYGFQNGTVDPDTTITLQRADIQDYGTGSMRYASPGTTYSIKTLARLMIEQSDNTAAYILSNHVLGLNTIQKLMDSWGLAQTDMVNNKTSNLDQQKLFDRIFSEKVASRALTMEMLGYLGNSDFNDRLPALLPKQVPVYHKIGTEVGNIHDVGIVGLTDRPYYIGVFVGDVSREEQTVKKISEISKAVYDYMN
jgi:beta-lactamase class A